MVFFRNNNLAEFEGIGAGGRGRMAGSGGGGKQHDTRPLARAAMGSMSRSNKVRCVGVSFMGDAPITSNHAW